MLSGGCPRGSRSRVFLVRSTSPKCECSVLSHSWDIFVYQPPPLRAGAFVAPDEITALHLRHFLLCRTWLGHRIAIPVPPQHQLHLSSSSTYAYTTWEAASLFKPLAPLFPLYPKYNKTEELRVANLMLRANLAESHFLYSEGPSVQ